MISKPFKFWTFGMGLLASMAATPADIDLFAGSQPTAANAPQVLIAMDTGAAFSASNATFRCNISSSGVVKTDGTGLAADFTALDSKNGGVEQCALYAVVKAIAASTTKMKVGIMFLNSNQGSYDPTNDTYGSLCINAQGGCLALPLTLIDGSTTATTNANILKWIKAWTIAGNTNTNIKSPASRGDGAMMQEAWAYYFGKTGMSQRDYSAIAPSSSGCATKNIIYLANNWDQQTKPNDATNTAGSPLLRLQSDISVPAAQRATPAATTTQLAIMTGTRPTGCGTNLGSLPTTENTGAIALNWVKYMKAQGVTTYSVGVEQETGNSCNATYGAWLDKMGSDTVGGGDFFSTSNFDDLVAALKSIAAKIASVNSVFAAVSLPVSVNTQGTYLNEIYVGMFRPAVNFLARWSGNLKQYKLGLTATGVLRMQDADSKLAINTNTGFITECARSFWTPNVADSYWAGTPSGGCLNFAGADSSNFPDGNIVEKGAQGYKLRAIAPSARRVMTCNPTHADCTTLFNFSTATATVTAALTADMINWARGTNLDLELSMASTVMRASAHGDVVHSRPIPINHGTDASPQIVVYYGGNDGMFRAINGNRGSATNTVTGVITAGGVDYQAGEELWSFVPPEFFSKFDRLRDNYPGISSPSTASNVATQKDYGMDGPITAFRGTIGGVAKVYAFATMRRGGRSIYAFDVTTPTSPTLLWKRGCPNAGDDVGCSTGYTGIGQTWSSLKTIFASSYGSGTSPLLITGGGYDTCEDYDSMSAGGANHNCTSSAKGNKVFVIDAATGAVVKAFDTDRPVVADSTLVRDNATGMIKYAYTADLGGNVYRMTFGNGAPASWTITKIASLGCDTLSACTANRKFMFAPSVVTVDNDTYSMMIGSGDREKPLTAFAASGAVTNYMFMIRDTISNGTASYTDTTNCGSGTSTLCKAALLPITSATPTASDLSTKRGWYLALASTEQVVTSALTVFGVLTFSTHQPAGPPPANSCVPTLGTTNVYNINYLNAATANGTSLRYEHVSGDGLPPSPVAGQVTLDNGQTVPFCIGCSKESPLEGAPPRSISTVTQPTSRLYWYIQK